MSESGKKASKVKTALVLLLAFALPFCIIILGAYWFYPAFNTVCRGWADSISTMCAPENPLWPSDAPEDQAVYDNDAVSVIADGSGLTAEYGDERDFTARRARIWETLYLKFHAGSADKGWLNAHTGTVYVTYAFDMGETTRIFYQHINDTGYVFVRDVAK